MKYKKLLVLKSGNRLLADMLPNMLLNSGIYTFSFVLPITRFLLDDEIISSKTNLSSGGEKQNSGI